MSRRTKTLVGVALAAAIGVFGLWFGFLRGNTPQAASIEAAAEAAGGDSASSSDSATIDSIDSIEGVWTVRTDDPASVSYPYGESDRSI